MKRLLSLLTAAALVLSLVPAGALATETVLCEHHPQHDANCGYSEAVPESPCTHVHTQECYSSATQCVHAHTEQCYSDGVLPAEGEEKTADACAHVCSADTGCITTALDCKHQHDETCGYAPATAGTPCTFVCETCSAAANESAQCTCESKCSEGLVDGECPVCAADPGSCTGKEAEPEEPVCTCTAKCAEGAASGECPVCGAEGADLSACQGKEPEQPQVITITEWSWVVTADTPKPADGKLYLPSAITEANLAGITDTLPKNIEASGQSIPVSWTYDWDAQTFTATLPAGYALAESAAPLTLETVDMGAGTLEKDPVGYIDENNQQKTCTTYTLVTGNDNAWNDGWYVVDSDVTIGRVTVSGDVKLILTDGCNLTVNGGIDVSGSNALTIYGQSGGTGSLEATGSEDNAGIGNGLRGDGGSITINGGSITANGGWGGAGIGSGRYGSGGSITITGGTVIATGGKYGAGIGGGNYSSGGSITINGGSITANGGEGGSGIGSGRYGFGGSITINGGSITANGGEGGSGIGGGRYGFGGSITINGGSITAKGGGNCGDIGVGREGGGITLSGSCGTVIRASAIWADTPDFNGIIYNGTAYQVYGNAVLEENLTIQPSETLTIPAGASLDCNGKLTNDGTILVESGGELVGTPTGSGTVKIAPTITTVSLPDGTVGTAYSQTLEATGDATITWSLASGSTLPDGLTLSTDGKISGTPTTAGSYNFTVTAANDSGSGSKAFTLTVTQPVTGVSLNETTLSLFTGQSETLTATVQPSDATTKAVTWSSNDETVATVDSNGKVTAVGAGEANITVTTEDGSHTGTCKVTVKARDISAAKVTLGASLAYNGGTQTQTVASVTLNGTTLKEGVDYTLSGNTGKDAGNYTLTVTGKGNYIGKTSKAWSIAKAKLDILSVDVQNKAYDGTTAATVTGVTFGGLVNKENLALGIDYTATADFENAAAGKGKAVSVKVTLLSSTLGKNYVLSDASFLTSGDISAAASKLSFKVDRTKPVKGQYITFSVTPQIKGDNRSFLQRVLGINAPKVEFWANGTTKLGEVKVEEGKTSTFAYDTDKGGLKLGKNTITAEFTGDGNLKGCTESVVVYLHDSTTSAPTGDESNIQTWTAVLVVSAVALVGLGVGAVIYRKKKK